MLQSNLAYWRYNTPRPQETWALFDPPPRGSASRSNSAKPVPGRRPAARTASSTRKLSQSPRSPLAAADRRLSGSATPAPSTERSRPPPLSSSTVAGLASSRPPRPGFWTTTPRSFTPRASTAIRSCSTRSLTPKSELVVTDSNRKVLERWSSVSDNIGETLPAVPGPTTAGPDLGRAADLRPCRARRHRASQSTAGAHYVSASAYGNPVSLTPEDRPAEAFDGNLDTAWSVAAFSDATGNWLQVRLDHPVTTDHINLVQVLGSTVNRWITRVTLRFDGKQAVTEKLVLVLANRPPARRSCSRPGASRRCGSRSTLRPGRAGSRSSAPPGSASPRSGSPA